MNRPSLKDRLSESRLVWAIMLGLIGASLTSLVTVSYAITSTNLGNTSIKLDKTPFDDLTLPADGELIVTPQSISLAGVNATKVGDTPPGIESAIGLPSLNTDLVDINYSYKFQVKEVSANSFEAGERFEIVVNQDGSPVGTLYMKQDTVDDGNIEGVSVEVDLGSAPVTSDQMSTVIIRAPSGATIYYLHNNPTPPTGDTNSQTGLPLDTTSPTATTLYNYDQDKDAQLGRSLSVGGSLGDDSDETKYQNWRSGPLSGGLSIVGTVTIDLWSAMKDFDTMDFDPTTVGEVSVFLRDYNGSGYTEIGSATIFEAWNPGSTWSKKTFTISGLNYTIPVNNQLEIKVIVGNNSQDAMEFAYDTTSYSSVVNIP